MADLTQEQELELIREASPPEQFRAPPIIEMVPGPDGGTFSIKQDQDYAWALFRQRRRAVLELGLTDEEVAELFHRFRLVPYATEEMAQDGPFMASLYHELDRFTQAIDLALALDAAGIEPRYKLWLDAQALGVAVRRVLIGEEGEPEFMGANPKEKRHG